MAKSDYVPNNDDQFAAQLQNFKTNLGGYAATLGVSAGQITAQAADADSFTYVLASQEIMQNGAQQWTEWKNLERRGSALPSAGAPIVPVFPAPVPAVAPGIESRFRALVKQIKASENYNSSIGHALTVNAQPSTVGLVYGYNIANNRLTRSETVGTAPAVTQTYGYDPADQVTFVNYDIGRSEAFSYDAARNRTSVADWATGTTAYTSNVLNPYTAVANDNPSYDPNSNLRGKYCLFKAEGSRLLTTGDSLPSVFCIMG